MSTTPAIEARSLSVDKARRLLEMLRAGATLDEAGYVLGARPTTMRRWLREDPHLSGSVKAAIEDARSRLGRTRADISFAAPVRETFLELLSQGHSLDAAANLCGLTGPNIQRLARQDDEFAMEIAHAKAEAETFYVGRILRDATEGPLGKTWIPALEWLKRNRTSTWGDIQKLEVFSKIEELRRTRDELIAEGIEPPPLDQMVAELQQISGPIKGRPRKLKALPPGEADEVAS